MVISKDRSVLIKGIVIVMMVFLHLFSGNHTDLCDNLLYIGNVPFAKWLSNACGPVDFFLLLSGYGLAFSFDNGKLDLGKQLKRLFRLYAHYWVTLLIFVSIGCFLASDRYPGTWDVVLLNAIGWEYGYDEPMWFLFPYCLVSLASPYIIRLILSIGYLRSLLLMGGVHLVTCYVISRYGAQYLYNNLLIYKPLLFFHFLYAFTVGVVIYYMKRPFARIQSWIAILGVVLLVAFASTYGNALVYMIYVPLMVFLLCQISYLPWLEKVLLELGKKSMPIWMIHIWYCYYLFQPQVYSLRYPLFILGGAILISYLSAIPIVWITNKCLGCLKI